MALKLSLNPAHPLLGKIRAIDPVLIRTSLLSLYGFRKCSTKSSFSGTSGETNDCWGECSSSPLFIENEFSGFFSFLVSYNLYLPTFCVVTSQVCYITLH